MTDNAAWQDETSICSVPPHLRRHQYWWEGSCLILRGVTNGKVDRWMHGVGHGCDGLLSQPPTSTSLDGPEVGGVRQQHVCATPVMACGQPAAKPGSHRPTSEQALAQVDAVAFQAARQQYTAPPGLPFPALPLPILAC